MSNNLLFSISILVFLGLIALENKINVKKPFRYKQVLLPAVAVIYSVVAALLLVYAGMRSGEVAVSNIRLMSVYCYIVNPLLVLVFIVVKLIYIRSIKTSGGPAGLISYMSDNFYEYNERYESWFLLDKWKNVKKMFFWFEIAATMLGCAAMSYGIGIAEEDSPVIGFTPALLIIVIVEINAFLGGNLLSEGDNFFGYNSSSENVSNYYRIRQVYEKIFPNRVLVADTGCDYISSSSAEDYVNRYKSSLNSRERDAAEYFRSNASGSKFDTDCLQAAIDLTNNKNVVFFNPFYRDLSRYLIMPVINVLLDQRKVLIVVGRRSNTDDVKAWMEDSIRSFAKMDYLWKVAVLGRDVPACEVGIIDFTQLYDLKTMSMNSEFFEDTKLVIMIEPSLSINTGQIGLRILSEHLTAELEDTVYCIVDRPTDGIVDTLSHVLHTDITTVVAPPVPRCCYTGMAWDADGDYIRRKLFEKQTKYLGNGLELAAVAVKNQIPHVAWFSETKAPVKDIKWIAGQYYDTLCKYMRVNVHQQSIYDKIDFVSNLWQASENKEQFLIVEDEFNNMFSTIRTFLSRGEEQAFINVMSEDYLLRDYMRYNKQMFMTNPNAIPSIVSDYAKTERNILIKALIQMAAGSLSSSEFGEQLALIGEDTEDVTASLVRLLHKYTYADMNILGIRADEDEDSIDDIYSINLSDFKREFADTLNSAYFIVEDEIRNAEYLDAKLYAHVTQSILPGQFITYGGKYYQAKVVSSDKGVILRRASDLYSGRKYYRQLRNYVFEERSENEVVSTRQIMDTEIAYLCRSFHVDTAGYLDMNDADDFKTARHIDFSKDPSISVYTRRFKNKSVLRILYPDMDAGTRYTLCVLLSEMFKTIFPNTWQYIAVVTGGIEADEETDKTLLKYLNYSVEGDIDDEYIYIIEDSDIDLGLLGAIERNFNRFMEIIDDYLVWHFTKIDEADPEPAEMGEVVIPDEIEEETGLDKLLRRLAGLFGRDRKKDKPEAITAAELTEEIEENPIEVEVEPEEAAAEIEDEQEEVEAESEESTEEVEVEPEEAAAEIEDEQEEITEKAAVPAEKHGNSAPTRYQRECFLKFGFDEIFSKFKLENLEAYLTARGYAENDLNKARNSEAFDAAQLDIKAVNHCDFCGVPISGVSYKKLSDGRICCNDCSTSAINTVEEFQELFKRIIRMYEGIYSVDFRTPISVGTADANVIAKQSGSVFKPSKEYAERVLGFAQNNKGKFTILMENGSPRLATTYAMVHELTHIWQFTNWDEQLVNSTYGTGSNKLIVYEGMAMWAAVQYLYLTGEKSFAKQSEWVAEQRDDVYGIGFRLFKEKYPFAEDIAELNQTPFTVFPPL